RPPEACSMKALPDPLAADNVTVPPLRVTSLLMLRYPLLPAPPSTRIVPLLVMVPVRKVVVPLLLVKVLPVEIVTPLRPALPLRDWNIPPPLVLSVPPVMVAFSTLTTLPAPAAVKFAPVFA